MKTIMKALKKQLNDAGYICDSAFAASVKAALVTKPVAGAILEGPIGTGKTWLPEILSQILKKQFFTYQCFPGTREEDLLIRMLPSEDTISGVSIHEGTLVQAIRATHESGSEVILLLDEWDKTRHSADAFLLDFLQTGRVSYAGTTLTADLSRLTVFLTANGERELSEPLTRRLPKIEFSPIPPSYVYRALSRTHAGHPFIHNAMILYERCLMADLPKPATIQELRQLLDAITALGGASDWDSLVYQFITKDDDAHLLLSRVEDMEIGWSVRSRVRLNTEAYDVQQIKDYSADADMIDLRMPRLAEARGFDYTITVSPDEPDLSNASGVIELNERVYSEASRIAGEPGESPDRLGDFAGVEGGRLLVMKNSLHFSDLDLVEPFWGENGEICILEPAASWEDVKALQEWAPFRIVKFSKQEILGKAEGIDLRWTPDKGAEIIINLCRRDVFSICFGRSWGERGESRWIGENGLIYQRYMDREHETA